VRIVDQQRAIQALQRQRALDITFLHQQHAPHVGMFDDGDLRRAEIASRWRAAPVAVARVMQRILVAGITEHGGAHADANTRLVHHVEHVAQPLVLFADQITDCPALLAEIEHGRRGAAPAHLVQQPGQRHIVARAEEPSALTRNAAR
jgi:hypothetical protein